jgi:hypothetical protein
MIVPNNNIILKQIKQWNCRRLLFFSLYASSDYYEFVSLQISLIEKSKIVGRYSVKTKKYEFDFQTLQGVLNTTLCDKVCQWLAAGLWFSTVYSKKI